MLPEEANHDIHSVFNWISLITGKHVATLETISDGILLIHLINKLCRTSIVPTFSLSEYEDIFPKAKAKKTLSKFQRVSNVNVLMDWLNNDRKSPYFGSSQSGDNAILGVTCMDIVESNDGYMTKFLWSLFWDFSLFIREPAQKDMQVIKTEFLKTWLLQFVSDINDFKASTWLTEKKLDELLNALELHGEEVQQDYGLSLFIDENSDEWSVYVYLCCLYETQKDKHPFIESREDTESEKGGEFVDFFGPNILSKASAISEHNYNMPLKLKIETFTVIVLDIIRLKKRYLRKVEKVLFELLEVFGEFVAYDNLEYSDDANIPQILSVNDIESAEKLMVNSTHINGSLNKAIESISFVENYRRSTKRRVYEQYVELQILRSQLQDVLATYHLHEFVDPPQKSIEKLTKFIELLKKSETNVYDNAQLFVNGTINKLTSKIVETSSLLNVKLDNLEEQILQINQSCWETRVQQFQSIKMEKIYELHLKTVHYQHQLQLINTSLAKGFDLNSSMIINNQRNRIQFLEDCINKSLTNMKYIETQKSDAVEVLKIAEAAEKYKSEINGLSEDDKQLKVHLFVLKLIQKKFHFQNIDPIRVLFDSHDTATKGYLTKSEFRRAFLKAYPDTEKLGGLEEIDTIFETSYEVVGKMRKSMAFPQFKAIISLGASMEDVNIKEVIECESEDDTISVSSRTSQFTRLIAEMENMPITTNLTSDYFLKEFNKLSSDKEVISKEDVNKINMNKHLEKHLEAIFPNRRYTLWFRQIEESTLYQDEESDEKTIVEEREIPLKNVLYELEKVDLNKL